MVYRPRVNDTLCFVLMPFRHPFNGYYDHIIKTVVRSFGMEPLRGDEVYGTKSIIRDVWEHIWRARVVIADVTDRNPNVNYELGLCHSLGVPTILITRRMEDVPFDYRHRRCIVYDTEDAKWSEKFSAALENTIRAVLSEDGHDDRELEWPYDTFLVRQLGGASAMMSVDNPRQMILRGMAQVEKLISRAIGPSGANVSVTLPSHQVVSHKQGSVIVQGIRSANPIEENGIEYMRKVGENLSAGVGDGTKTAMLLAFALVEGGEAALIKGHSLKETLSGIERGVEAALASIMNQSQNCTPECLSAVALTASGYRDISELVIQATGTAGNDGVVVLETKPGASSELQIKEGLRFDRGYLSDTFATNARTGECELADCRVLVHELKISNMKDLLPLLEKIAVEGRPLLIIADDVEGEALATLVVNNVRGTVKCAAVRAPGNGDRRRALLQDIAVLTGAKLLAAVQGPRLESVNLEDLGSAERVVVTREETTVFGGKGAEQAVHAHIDGLRAAIERAQNSYDRERLQERLANLAGKIAIVRVGGATEVDVEERRYRAASAMHSIRAALEEGWSYGGGVAFLNAKEALAEMSFETAGEQAGFAVVLEALERPFVALAASCSKSHVGLLSERRRLARPTIGLNVETGTLEDMVVAGILDPTKTLRTAMDTALSYARAILKTDVWSMSPEAPRDAG